MRRLLLLLPVLLFFAIPLFSQNSKTTVTVTDMLKIKSISGITLTANGNRAAFTVTAIEPDGESKTDYKYVNHIYVMNPDGLEPAREMTTKESSSQPAWSPDGRQLAFVRAVDGKPQVFLISMDGGEAVQFTHFRYGAGTPKWSPDGKTILFSSSIPLNDLIKDTLLNPSHAVPKWSFEKPGIENETALKSSAAKADPDGNLEQVKAWLEINEKDKKAKVIDKLNFQDEMNVSAEMAFNHFFIQPLTPGSLPTEITHGFYNYQDVDFITNGQRILISAGIDSSEHPDRVLESGIYIADADGSHLEKILGEKEKRYSGASASPNGSWLTFLRSSTSFVTVPALFLMPLNGAVKDAIEIPVDRNKGGFTWSADEKYLYFTAQSNGGAPLFRLDVITKKAEPLTDVNSGVISFDIKNNRLVYAKTEVTDPFDIYTADGSVQNPKRISSFNYDWVKNKELSIPEKHEFKNNKGVTIEYWVMKPLHAEKGKKYPLLLDIHGGPSAMWGPGETSMWHEFQFFCAKGYGVVYCNPRGSGGYGLNFLRSNVEDWGAGPTSDVLTALDKAVGEGWADTSKLLVSGGSYAGYLVAWIIAHDHRFKAACSQRGVYDLATFFGEGNAWRLVPNYFGGYPWEAKTKAILDRESPISYVQNITTPYIIFHGDNDRRTGFVEGEMLYRSLKVLGRPVEYVRHQNGTHELTRSGDNRQRMDQILRTWEFFERWLKK